MARNYSWMIYGATGYTGTLVAEEAVKRGHAPILAGRNREKLAPLAKRLDLKYIAFDLDDVNTIAGAIADVDVVYHAAGPFIRTSDPMIRACLATKTHYLDITGEIAVYENTFSYHDAALKNGIALIGGVGFDVVPTDCLALYVAQQVKGAYSLETAFMALGDVSPGTGKSVLELTPNGGLIRQEGVLTPYPIGKGGKKIRFSHGEYFAAPIPWGDLATAYRTTGIPNITSYMVMPRAMAMAGRIFAPVAGFAMKAPALRRLGEKLIDRYLTGPAEARRDTGRSYIRAKAANKEGTVTVEAWLETPEAYRFTAESGVLAVERTAEYHPVGALTPALAFGPDFVLDIPGTTRLDRLG